MKVRLGIIGLALISSLSSCSDSDSSGGAGAAEATSEGQDLTQPFTLAISGADLEVPANSLAAGTSLTLRTGTQPSEFTSTTETAPTASGVTEITATDSAGATLEKAVAPLTLAINLTVSPGLTSSVADIEKTADNLCVLGKGTDGTVRRWPKARITLTGGSKVSFPSIWFGTYQVLYCGTAFDSLPEVNAAGTEATAGTETPTTETTASSATSDGTCNSLENIGTTLYPDESTDETPQGTGGTPVKGTYKLTGFVVYDGSPITPNTALKQTLEYTSSTDVQVVDEKEDGTIVRESFTMEAAGTFPNLTRTCVTDGGDDAIDYLSYTATDTTITFFAETFYKFSVTYTKQ